MLTLNTFTDNFTKDLGDFQNNVIYSVKKELEPKEIHNHPPVSYTVVGCAYCEKYGNCFSNKPYAL